MAEPEKQAAEIPQVLGESETRDPPEEVKERGYEGVESKPKVILMAAAGLLTLVACGVILALWLMASMSARRDVELGDEAPAAVQPQVVDVQPNQAVETQRQRQRMWQVLHSYGWVQRDPAIARIPIARAIDVIAERGFQPWGQGQAGGSGQGERDASP